MTDPARRLLAALVEAIDFLTPNEEKVVLWPELKAARAFLDAPEPPGIDVERLIKAVRLPETSIVRHMKSEPYKRGWVNGYDSAIAKLASLAAASDPAAGEGEGP